MQQILAQFLQRTMRLAFAYGSGVFQQHGNSYMKNNMIDFIFAVDDPVAWHQENLKSNIKHYSSLRYLGPKYIARVQDSIGARIYYNTLVSCGDRLIKYGVIGVKSLIDDLLDWETLYVSGRLHKPVAMLRKDDSHAELGQALAANLNSAVHASLLQLPEQFSEEELFLTVAGLSYNGDLRMTVGEDRDKVQNIVRPNVERFRRLYETVLRNDEHFFWNRTERSFEQSFSPAS